MTRTGIKAALSDLLLDEHITLTEAADRHTCHITKKDGSTVSMEVYVFADLSPDGRFQRIEETTLLLKGSDADRNLGSAR